MGVYWGWVVCFSFLLLFTLSAGIAFSFGEMIIPITKEVHVSVSLLVWVGALPSSLPMLAAPLATWINYRFGTRRVVLVGVFLTTLSLSWMGMASNILLTLGAYGVLSGVGILLLVNPPFYLLEEYFPYDHPRHVLATSLIACGFPLATIIFNPVTYEMISAVGWRFSYSIFAILMFIVGMATALTFRPCRPEELANEMTPSSSATPKPFADRQVGNYVEIGDASEVKATPQSATSSAVYTGSLKAQVLLGYIWFMASILKSMGYYTPIATLVKQMDVLGIPQSQSSSAMALIGSCEVVSRLVTSYFGDRFKGQILPIYVVCTVALCFQNAIGSLAVTYTHLLIYAAAQGFSGGPIIAAMYSSCSEVLDGHHVPMVFSLFRTGLGIGSLLGPTLAGAIFDMTGSFRPVFYLNCVTYALTCALYLIVIIINRKRPACLFPVIPEVPDREASPASYGSRTQPNLQKRNSIAMEETVLYDRKTDYTSITSSTPSVISNGFAEH